MTRPAWQALAACRDKEPALFFPDGEPGGYYDYSAALVVCAGCVVRPECLEAGLEETHGVWGGLSPRARLQLVRKRGDTVGCSGCGAALPRIRGRGAAQQPWCADEACQKEARRRRTVAYRQRKNQLRTRRSA